MLEGAGFLRREPDAFRPARSSFRITEPLVTFYHAVMRPQWARPERPGNAVAVWRDAQPRFASAVLGPHFAALCRAWTDQLERLRRIRRLLTNQQRPGAAQAHLTCYSGTGFTDDLRQLAEQDGEVVLVDLDRLYRNTNVIS